MSIQTPSLQWPDTTASPDHIISDIMANTTLFSFICFVYLSNDF